MPPRPLRRPMALGENGMRFLVLGAGSLGGYLGGMLMKGGADVAFLVRPGRAAQLAGRGLVVRLPDGEFRQQVRTLAAGEIDGPYDVVLLTCKSYDLASAIDAVAPALGERSVVLPVLNGLNHIAVLSDRFGRGRVLGGVSNIAAARSPEGEVIPLPGPERHHGFRRIERDRDGALRRHPARLCRRRRAVPGQRRHHGRDVGEAVRLCRDRR